MPETPFGSLESLVGRTFERGRIARRVMLAAAGIAITMDLETGLKMTWATRSLVVWLSGATEVHNGQG